MENASNEYLRNAVLTAPPERLHLMLYDGAMRFARQGIEGIKAKDWEKAFNGFSRAQKIVLEMLNALDYDVDRALCTRMASLYNFIYRKLVDACANRDVSAGEEALKILDFQRETWAMLIDKLNQERPSSGVSAGSPTDHDLTGSPYNTLSVEG